MGKSFFIQAVKLFTSRLAGKLWVEVPRSMEGTTREVWMRNLTLGLLSWKTTSQTWAGIGTVCSIT